MAKPNGVHHIAVMTADLKEQIEFFTDVMGCELVALYDLHGVENGAGHCFFKLNDESYFSVVYSPSIANIEPQYGVSHPTRQPEPGGLHAKGTLDHLAFNVSNMDDLIAMRDRIRSRGYNCIGPVNHGFCHSIYFAGPDLLSLEVSFSEQAIDEKLWIDPKWIDSLGISEEELARYISPDPYPGEGGAVAQPEYNGVWNPNMGEGWAVMGTMSDEDFVANMPDVSAPPVDPNA